MKRIISTVILSIVCVLFCGCGNKTAPVENGDLQTMTTGSNQANNYVYYVEGLEGVNNCAYFKPNDSVPDYLTPDEALGKICVWKICPTCGENGGFFSFDPGDLDFSQRDTIIYSDYESCNNCNYGKSYNFSYTWAVKITRVAE